MVAAAFASLMVAFRLVHAIIRLARGRRPRLERAGIDGNQTGFPNPDCLLSGGNLVELQDCSWPVSDCLLKAPRRQSLRDAYLPLVGVRFAALGPAACIDGRVSLTDEPG